MRTNARILSASSVLSAPMIGHLSAYAYDNTLTGLLGQLYSALDVVSRELVGFVPSSARAPGVERAAVGQSVMYAVSTAKAAQDIVPAMQVPEPRDTAWNNGTMAITKSRRVEFGWTGEEQRAVNNGVGYLTVQGSAFAEALRTLTNEIETDLAVEAVANASRAYGTPGTTPFAGDRLRDSAYMAKILKDNGASGPKSLVLNTTAGAELVAHPNMSRVNEAGDQMTLRQGEIGLLHSMSVKESAADVTHVKGTATNATTNAAGYAVGATVITLAAVAGGGTILAGDTITFAGDTNKYVVVSGDADTTDGGEITISEPGLRVAIPASATAITVGGTYSANVAFAQSALHLVTRLPALPNEGDLALDRMTITDPRSGLAFEVALYPGYRKISAEVAVAWGVKATKREHIALLLG